MKADPQSDSWRTCTVVLSHSGLSIKGLGGLKDSDEVRLGTCSLTDKLQRSVSVFNKSRVGTRFESILWVYNDEFLIAGVSSSRASFRSDSGPLQEILGRV